ncbi:MAG: hypothetical protein RL320_305 [Pseudomonadota bacterium]
MSAQREPLEIGLIIVGDEILSGKREDRHFSKTRELLAARGLALSWVSILGDSPSRCTQLLRQTFSSGDLVFSLGGIGSTPDDYTRQSAAQALGRPLVLHPEARDLIAQRSQESGQPLTPERLRMGEFPEGAQIVPNPFNRIPGFQVGRHYFLPGFPVMAWPMMEWVLDTHFKDWFQPHAELDWSMTVLKIFEAAVTPLLEQISREYPTLRIYSLPSGPVPGESSLPPKRHLELGVKLTGVEAQRLDEQARVDAEALMAKAYAELRAGVLALGGEVTDEKQLRR